jgi:hypothetical protein
VTTRKAAATLTRKILHGDPAGEVTRAEEVILAACMDTEKDRRLAGMSADQMGSTT